MGSTISFSEDITLTYDGTDLKNGETVITDRPISLNNTSETQKTVYLNFAAPVDSGDVDLRFLIHSNNITIDGLNNEIVITCEAYLGLVQNAEAPEMAYSNIQIQNVKLMSTGSLAEEGGWICTKYFKNCVMTNCFVCSGINNAGGLFGNECTECTANRCSYYGPVTEGGAIFGNLCYECYAVSCFSSGTLSNSGGIFGNSCYNCTAEKCFSYGDMLISGGIFGLNTNSDKTNATSIAKKCYSLGKIGAKDLCNSGGIFGCNSNNSASGSLCKAEACFSMGDIYGDGGDACGGIFGTSSNMAAIESTVIAVYCFSRGSIGQYGGGIFSSGSHMQANDCYSHGAIGIEAGGICGKWTENTTITNCYARGDIDDNGGGIVGSSSESSSVSNCYSTGLASETAGGIFGSLAGEPIISDCYVTSSGLCGIDVSGETITNSVAEGTNSWDYGNSSITVYNSDHWIEVSEFKPYLLSQCEQINMPIGYGYSYVYQSEPTEVINGESTNMQILTGYYDLEQMSDTVVDTGFIYGYSLETASFIVDASGGTGGSGEELVMDLTGNNFAFDNLRSFEPIWTCSDEKL